MIIIPLAITAATVVLCHIKLHKMKGRSLKLLFICYSYAGRYNYYKLAAEAG